MTYTLLDSVTLASSAASVTFSSIDQSYGDLVLVVDYAPASGSIGCNFRLNGDTSSSYYTLLMYGNGSTSGSYDAGANDRTVQWSSASTFGLKTFNIMDYTATDKHKSILSRENQENIVTAYAYRWASTSAVTSIEILGTGGSYAAGSTFHLYAIAKAL